MSQLPFMSKNMNMETKPVTIKVMVDERKNRFIFAEAENDFVDILFSFLTLPMGSIIRLLRKQTPQSQEVAEIGCLNQIYQSLESLSKTHFLMDACKDMLLHPRNPLEHDCRRLKVNVDKTNQLKYYICSDLACSRKQIGGLLSNFNDVRCSCGKLMNREIFWSVKDEKDDTCAVFLKASTTYIISDNLKVMPSSPGALVEFLVNTGVKDVNCLREQVISVGYDEVLNILKRSLQSTSPLTDVFCSSEDPYSNSFPCELRFQQLPYQKVSEDTNRRMVLKILLQKSNNKVLYAETSEDFVELLFSFLTLPLAKVVYNLEGRSSLGSIDNLNTSVLSLFQSLQHLFIFAPGILDQSNLQIFKPKYCCCSKLSIWGSTYSLGLEDCHFLQGNSTTVVAPLTLTDPKPPTQEKGKKEYLRRPGRFWISDSLQVKPWPTSTSSISILKDLGVPIGDIEERVLTISNQEAWILLKESLLTQSALTNFVRMVSKKMKIKSELSKLKL